MSHEKRLVLCFILVFLWMFVSSYISRQLGWAPAPKKPPPVAAAEQDKDAKPGDAKPSEAAVQKDGAVVKNGPPAKDALAAKEEANPKTAAQKGTDRPAADAAAGDKPRPPAERTPPELVASKELILGSATDKSPGGYHIELQLQQKGAGVDSVLSSRFDAEFKYGELHKRPLEFIRSDPDSPSSLSLTLTRGDKAGQAAVVLTGDDEADDAKLAIARAAAEAEDMLDSELWDVVRDPKDGRVVRAVERTDPVTSQVQAGQEVVFRIKAPVGVIVTKTYRLFPNDDGFEVELKLESPDAERSLVYNLLGPHGMPIEGIWYTNTFRDLFFGQLTSGGEIDIKTHSAYDVASATASPIDNTALPLRFAGVENQYFADLIEPYPPPTSQEERWESKAIAEAFGAPRKGDSEALQRADVGVRISSKPLSVGPNQPVVHTYRVFTGPKTTQALSPYGAQKLASYRKPYSIPGASYIARVIITPILGFTYQVTERVSRFFGGTRGNYGIAIILLTVLVRALMFPLGRKAALSAQKMQSLQPLLKELQEKFKDDKEKQTRETFALYKRHGVNPVGGCLPALIQLPIFVGLWQALNTSFPLRHEKFLWIRDLAAPDMLFHLPFELSLAWLPWPFTSVNLGSWINVLPFLVVGLMLIQTKLFSPPATTPDMEMQQKSMRIVMVLMAFMFYKVPSGLGIYFITSSLWAIGERLLLPKVTHAKATDEESRSATESSTAKGTGAGGGRGSANGDSPGNGAKDKAPGWFSQLWDRLLEEARKDGTYRKVVEDRGDDKSREKDRDRDRDRPRPKPRRR